MSRFPSSATTAPQAQPDTGRRPSFGRRWGWLLLLLLAAASLRLLLLDQAPPGLTHDEADHALDAWRILQGARPLYLTTSNGREPLYDYATALVMAASGRTYLAGRLTAAYFSLLLLAATYTWTRLAFDRRVALLTAAALALSFWPVAVGRQALRTATLPALFSLALALFWLGWRRLAKRGRRAWPLFAAAGLLLGLTFYTYIPARALWLVLPAAAAWATLAAWRRNRRPDWALARHTLLTLGLALLLGLPLFLYLGQNPAAEARIDQLATPLTAARAGDWTPLHDNVAGALALFSGNGDSAWRYTIPGRPLLTPLLGLLFYAGLLLATWHLLRTPSHRPAAGAATALAGLTLGLAPVLITGPALSTTQGAGMMPFLYLFPALALAAAGRWLARRFDAGRAAFAALALLLFLGEGVLTARDYFGVWANEPAVRVQYEATLVAAITYLNNHGVGPAAISTITPDPFHSPAVAAATLRNPAVSPRWFDGHGALLLPQDAPGLLLFSGFAPLHPALQPFLGGTPVQVLPLRASDLDRPLTIYEIDGPAWLAAHQADFTPPAGNVSFGDAVTLLGHQVQAPSAPDAPLRLLTLWRIDDAVGEALVLFSHVGDDDAPPLAQADKLDVASQVWQPGDLFVQLHEIGLPADLPAGEYPLRIGFYHCPASCAAAVRLPLRVAGAPAGDRYLLADVTVAP